MKHDTGDWCRGIGWALPASVSLHVLIAAFLILELPLSLPNPQEEQAVSVELVLPPESPSVEPPPSPKEPDKPEAAKAPSQRNQTSRPQPLPALQPVFQFGEKDSGPRETLDGSSGQDGSVRQPADADALSEPTPEPVPAESGDGTDAASAPQDILRSPDGQVPAGPPASSAETAEIQISLPEIAEAPSPKPARSVESASEPKLQEAERLFSQSATADRTATTSMADVPRGVRAGRLCTTEMREQLRSASPPYFPDLLPTYPLTNGDVLEISTAAFRVRGQWYDLGFRCTVDSDATKVVSFAFRVGEPVPRSEWARRELPEG